MTLTQKTELLDQIDEGESVENVKETMETKLTNNRIFKTDPSEEIDNFTDSLERAQPTEAITPIDQMKIDESKDKMEDNN